MDRRDFNSVSISALVCLTGLAHRHAQALTLADLTHADASAGLKAALTKGTATAIESLGKTDGFLGNMLVRIPLPAFLEKAAGLMRTLGQGGRMDELVTAMNRAAEAAVPLAKDLLASAIQGMNVQEAKKILSGGATSVTDFFAEKTRAPLESRFLPVVTQATEKVGLASQYNELASKASELGLIDKAQANIQKYVTGKSLDGLYLMIGEEERKIRQDPMGTGSAILKKVFGAL
jgi:Protein of unknown function (DUF4197)